MKILIADTRQENYRSIHTLLKKLNHSSISASNGAQAYNLFVRENPEVLVIDCTNPAMGHEQLIPVLKQSAKGSSSKFVVLTEEKDLASLQNNLKSYNIDAFITHPIKLNKFFQTLRDLNPEEFPRDELRKAIKELLATDKGLNGNGDDLLGGVPQSRYIELETVEMGVLAALELLMQNGRLAVISFQIGRAHV